MNDSCSCSVISASGAYSCAESSIRKGCRFKTPPGRLHRDLVSFRLQITFFMGLESLCWGTMDSFYGRPLLKLVGFLLLDGNLVLSGAFLNRSGCWEWT